MAEINWAEINWAEIFVVIIVLVIIVLQGYFFYKNLRRMREYKDIFSKPDSWEITHDAETDFVSGIDGEGNDVFVSIKNSMNKYLGSATGSVIDFSLLKDAIDRHCDSVENDINTLTPVPLYCGLAGTMAGVIVGLGALLAKGSITDLLSSETLGGAAAGVNGLLSGVAWAMVASICGIFLTTIGSIVFKKYKLEGEAGKNTFLAWLQSRLLPELPSDTSDALNRLVKNLNRFNSTFASNTTELRGALTQVNESYRIQGEIIKAVHDMDVMKMAKANVRVLQELQECTGKLEEFNEYLQSIHGYTNAINEFTTRFESLGVLDEIKYYFVNHRAELLKDSADVDKAFKDAMKELKEGATSNALDVNKVLVQQAEEFKRILEEEKESFEKANSHIQAQFSAQLSQFPMLRDKLSEVSTIPSKLDKLIERMEKSNALMAKKVEASVEKAVREIPTGGEGSTPSGSSFPSWMKWVVVGCVILTALACIFNTAYNVFMNRPAQQEVVTDTISTEASDSIRMGTQGNGVSDTVSRTNTLPSSPNPQGTEHQGGTNPTGNAQL